MANKILPVIVFASMVVVTSVVGVTFFYLGKALAEKECREAATAKEKVFSRRFDRGNVALVERRSDKTIMVGVVKPIWSTSSNLVEVCLAEMDRQTTKPKRVWCGYVLK